MPEAEDSVAAAPTGGAVFLPTHGVELVGDNLQCHGLTFRVVDGQTWSLLEAVWMRDQELEFWQQRVFAVMPYEGDVQLIEDPVFARTFDAYSEIVAVARLIAPGVWIDAEHLAAVAHGNNGMNLRIAGARRPRLWAAVFGEPVKVRGRLRQWGDRAECRPLQFHLPHGPSYVLDEERAQTIERGIAVLAELRQLAPYHAWGIAHRAFQRGHDIFLPRRVRLAALFGAFEAVFGPFRREPGDPGAGAAVAAALERSGWEAEDPAGYVEKTLRQARNRLAHGSDVGAPIHFASVEENLIDILRTGLAFSSAWIRGVQQPDGPIPPGPDRTLIEFQRWLGRRVPDEE